MNRTVRDGNSYASGLIPFPEEWLVEKDWRIANHWENQLCREAYQELCLLDGIQPPRAAAMALPGATPETLLKVPPTCVVSQSVQVDNLDLCARKWILGHEHLAVLKLKLRSDVL